MLGPESDPTKETFVLHEISPQLAEELMRRARENNTDPATEAANIIEQHIEEENGLT